MVIEATVVAGGLAVEDTGRGQRVGEDGDQLLSRRVRGEAEQAMGNVKAPPTLLGGDVLGKYLHTPVEGGDRLGFEVRKGAGEEIGVPGVIAIEESDIVGLRKPEAVVTGGAGAGVGLID